MAGEKCFVKTGGDVCHGSGILTLPACCQISEEAMEYHFDQWQNTKHTQIKRTLQKRSEFRAMGVLSITTAPPGRKGLKTLLPTLDMYGENNCDVI
jgi:hypothetical protein